MKALLCKLRQTRQLIFKLCTLDVAVTREAAAQKLTEAIGLQYDVLKDKKANRTQKQKAARIMGYLIQVLNATLEGVTVDQILAKWNKVEKLAEGEYGKAGQGSGEVASATPAA